jgi:hypothetical protein
MAPAMPRNHVAQGAGGDRWRRLRCAPPRVLSRAGAPDLSGDAAWDAIAPRYRGRPIAIYGRSLGTGLAAALARDVAPQLLFLVSPYTNLADAARRAYPIAPPFLLKYPLHTDQIVGDIRSPVLRIHGTRDALIPPADGEKLRALARSPVELLAVEGAGHNDIQRFPGYVEPLAERLVRLGGN